MLGTMPFLRSADLDLFYTDQGTDTGTALLLVHGWACDSHDWSWQIPALTDVHRVIAADLRGHGSSSYRGDEITVRVFAADLIALLDHLGIARAILVGHSMGAVIASTIAAQHPHRVSGLVVIDPPYGFDADDAVTNLDFAAEIDAANATRLASERLRGAEGPATPAALVTLHQRRIQSVAPKVLAAAVHDVHGSLDSVVNLPHSERLIAARRAPVLAVYTSEERAAWERALLSSDGSAALAFEGAGHWLHQERPDEFNRTLLEWIETLP
jgi:pimeloyl-ACP methyl ester carboxylesterase